MFRKKVTVADPDRADWLIVGLGNPGGQYAHTRHNCGFDTVDRLCTQLGGTKIDRLRYKALYTPCLLDDMTVVLAKPQTYMNLSGESVRELCQRFRVPVEKVIVVFDDLDTAEGRIRVKRSGSAGGHNGIKSIIYQLQSDAFPRVKIGIGTPEKNDGDTKDFVLNNMSLASRKAIEAAPDAVLEIIRRGPDAAMQDFNGKDFSGAD